MIRLYIFLQYGHSVVQTGLPRCMAEGGEVAHHSIQMLCSAQLSSSSLSDSLS